MEKRLQCNAVVPGCPAEMRCMTDEEVLRQAAEHARTAHGIEQMDEQTTAKVRAAIGPAR
jgi:predicted small metal-binding protein